MRASITNRWLTLRGYGCSMDAGCSGSTPKLAASRSPSRRPRRRSRSRFRVPAGPPPEVIFSAPTDDETDVATTTAVRIQFSRDLDLVHAEGKVKAS